MRGKWSVSLITVGPHVSVINRKSAAVVHAGNKRTLSPIIIFFMVAPV